MEAYIFPKNIEGCISSCILKPIQKWANNKFMQSNCMTTKYRYSRIVKKLDIYLTYSNIMNILQEICNTLQIDIHLDVKIQSIKKKLKIFKFYFIDVDFPSDGYIHLPKDSKFDLKELEEICKKYNIINSLENQEKIKDVIKRKVYSYNYRDNKRKKRYVTFDSNLDGYSMSKNEIQNLNLAGKSITELTYIEKNQILEYIKYTLQPILLYKLNDSKLLVDKMPTFCDINCKELCRLLLNSETKCTYCKCEMTLLNTTYNEKCLTFDAIIPLNGHRYDNLCLSCIVCNTKKGINNAFD